MKSLDELTPQATHRLRVVLSLVGAVITCSFAVTTAQDSDHTRTYDTQLKRLSQLPDTQLVDMTAVQAPTISEFIRGDTLLKEALAAESYSRALAQVALLVASNDPDCQDAVRIIGDAIERPHANVETISIDGSAREWHRILPSPKSRIWPHETADRAREVWKHGVAAVVRNDRMYVLAGLADESCFDSPESCITITIDCRQDTDWDAVVNVRRKGEQWSGVCDFVTRGRPPKPPVQVTDLEVALGQVVELAFAIDAFAPPSTAKSIWNINLRCQTNSAGQPMWPRTQNIPVFNETARPGVGAEPYVRNLMFLAADVGLNESDRTAAAIAITSATIYTTGNDQVRAQLRKDNAELLTFARETAVWQRELKTDYRLNEYPLEAQLAWANRLIWLGLGYLSWNRKHDRIADMENYRWSFVPVETLRKLQDMARRDELIDTSVAETSRRIDAWVTGKMVRRAYIEHVRRAMEQQKDNPEAYAKLKEEYEALRRLRESGEATVGHFKGGPVYQVFARNTEAYVKLIETEGHFYGGCPDQAWVCQDMLRAVGIAPLAMVVSGRSGHCWAGHYEPAIRLWRSSQVGRDGPHKWYFSLDPIAIYPDAATATHADSQRKWQPFSPEIPGNMIRKLTQNGVPTRRVRDWMLTPHF